MFQNCNKSKEEETNSGSASNTATAMNVTPEDPMGPEASSSNLVSQRGARHVSATEATQTAEVKPPEYVVNSKAMAIWLLSKKHRSYEQRATLRARLIDDLLKLSMAPLWTIRRDYLPRPQYVVMTPGLLALYKRHAMEVAAQARDDLLLAASEEGSKADEYLNLTQTIYIKHKDNDFFKAESRIVDIIDKYGIQEKKKLSASFVKDREAFPMDDEAWQATTMEPARPSTSRVRSRSQPGSSSTSRERKRPRDTSSGSDPSPPPPPSPPSQGTSTAPRKSSSGYKGKAGPTGHVKGSSRRSTNQEPPARREPSPQQQRGRSASRGARGGTSRGRGRGRGRGNNTQYQRRDRSDFSSEDRAFFEKLKEHFKKD